MKKAYRQILEKDLLEKSVQLSESNEISNHRIQNSPCKTAQRKIGDIALGNIESVSKRNEFVDLDGSVNFLKDTKLAEGRTYRHPVIEEESDTSTSGKTYSESSVEDTVKKGKQSTAENTTADKWGNLNFFVEEGKIISEEGRSNQQASKQASKNILEFNKTQSKSRTTVDSGVSSATHIADVKRTSRREAAEDKELEECGYSDSTSMGSGASRDGEVVDEDPQYAQRSMAPISGQRSAGSEVQSRSQSSMPHKGSSISRNLSRSLLQTSGPSKSMVQSTVSRFIGKLNRICL